MLERELQHVLGTNHAGVWCLGREREGRGGGEREEGGREGGKERKEEEGKGREERGKISY